MLWLFASKFFPPLSNFLVFTYTARILAPEDFGLVAFALSFIYILNGIMPTGWRDAIIKYQVDDKETISSIVWLTFFVAITLTCIVFVFVWLSFFDFQTDLFNAALMTFCIKIIFDNLFYTLNTVLLKKQLYSLIAIRTFASTIISGCLIIGMLMLDFGIWALIFAQCILSFSNFLAVYFPCRKLIIFHFSLNKLKKLNDFAIYTTLTLGVSSLLNNYQSIVVGGILGHRELGFYNVAKRLSNISSDIFIGTVDDIAFPLLARKQKKFDEFRKAFMDSVYFSVVLLFPLFTFLFIGSEKIFLLLFTEKWLNSVIVFQTFCFMFGFVILTIPQRNVVVLSNHAKWWFHLQLKLSVIVIPVTTISAYSGLNYLLVAIIASNVLYFTASMFKTCALLSLKVKDYLLSFLTPLLCCLSVGFTTYFLNPYIPHVNILLIDIIIEAVIYFLSYFVFLYLFEGKKLIEIASTVFPKNEKLKALYQKQTN